MRDDDQWLDVLAGRSVPGIDEGTRVEAWLFREALLACPPDAVDSLAPVDPRRTAALLARADRAGILAARSVPENDAPVRRLLRALDAVTALSSLQRLSAICLLLVVCVPLLLLLRPASEQAPAQRAPSNAIVVLHDEHPAEAKAQLMQELTAAGLKPTGYTRFGRVGIDVDLGSPVSPAAQKVLDRHGWTAPADGVLQVEIEGRT